MSNRHRRLLFYSMLIAHSLCNGTEKPYQFKKEQRSLIKSQKVDSSTTMITKLLLDGILDFKIIRAVIYRVPIYSLKHLKKLHIPRANLFFSDIFGSGRTLGNMFDDTFIYTDTPYKEETEEIRKGIIKGLLETRDFSFGYAGYLLKKSSEKGISKIPALKLFALGTVLEALLEKKYVNNLFEIDKPYTNEQGPTVQEDKTEVRKRTFDNELVTRIPLDINTTINTEKNFLDIKPLKFSDLL